MERYKFIKLMESVQKVKERYRKGCTKEVASEQAYMEERHFHD